jgi:hypothetical protein
MCSCTQTRTNRSLAAGYPRQEPACQDGCEQGVLHVPSAQAAVLVRYWLEASCDLVGFRVLNRTQYHAMGLVCTGG